MRKDKKPCIIKFVSMAIPAHLNRFNF